MSLYKTQDQLEALNTEKIKERQRALSAYEAMITHFIFDKDSADYTVGKDPARNEILFFSLIADAEKSVRIITPDILSLSHALIRPDLSLSPRKVSILTQNEGSLKNDTVQNSIVPTLQKYSNKPKYNSYIDVRVSPNNDFFAQGHAITTVIVDDRMYAFIGEKDTVTFSFNRPKDAKKLGLAFDEKMETAIPFSMVTDPKFAENKKLYEEEKNNSWKNKLRRLIHV
jgi:hypothetical protein